MKTSEKFINETNKLHKNKYDYTLVKYINNSSKVIIKCKKHGEFNQIPAAHLRGQGCPICQDSKGEIHIKEFLIKYNIAFTPQKRFPDCRNILPLPFDFYLLDLNTCIEYQGIQHFKPRSIFGGNKELKNVQLRDMIKSKYCENKGITLLTINYNENISNKLLTFLGSNIFKTTT